MAAKKGTSNRKVSEAYEDMYICMNDAIEKKKYVLEGIKNSLIMQEEYEKIIEFRKNKGLITKEIKSEMTKLNTLYQQLKKELPNVKGVLSYTEKELEELEDQINSLKDTIYSENKDLKKTEKVRDTVEELNTGLKKDKEKISKKISEKTEVKPEIKVQKKEEPKIQVHKQDPKKPLSKLERIKNNLKVIEGKIKDI